MSSRGFRVLWAVIAVLAIQCAAMAGTLPRIDPADAKNIMLVKDLKIGMKGYGKTVFKGTKIETFKVEVLGVLDKANLGTELVVVKLSGGPITSRGANLIEGMSGSPIYINGKLLGAFAYGNIFGKEPIGMVTPIQYMLEAWDPALPSQPSSFYPFSSSESELDHPLSVGGKEYSRISIADPSDDNPIDTGALSFRPLAIPIMVSGGSPKIIAGLQKSLKSMNVRLTAGPGARSNVTGAKKTDLVPGAALGASFVTGDIDMTGIGTVTYRRGNKIVAFGHPMFGLGSVDTLLTSAYVYDVFPSLMVSNKIAAPTGPLGRVYQDRPWCIAGEIGKMPDLIPITIHVNNTTTNRKKDFHCKVVRHPMLTTIFTSAVVSEAILEDTGTPADSTAKVRFVVDANEVGKIERENTYFDPASIDSTAVSELQQVMMMMQFNPFYPVGVKKVEAWVDIMPRHSTARLERIFLKESKFKPGDTVEIGAVLRPFKGDRVIKTIKIKLPSNLPDGPMPLIVSSGGAASSTISISDEGESGSAAGITAQQTSSAQATPSMDNLKQMVKKFTDRNKNNELVAKIIYPKPIPSIAGVKFPDLPPSIAAVMKTTKTSAIGSDRQEIKEVVPTDWVISGMQRLIITIQHDDSKESKSAEKTSVTTTSTSSSTTEVTADDSDSDSTDDAAAVSPGESPRVPVDMITTPTPAPQKKPEIKPVPDKPKTDAGTKSMEETTAATKSDTSTTTEDKTASTTDEKPIGRAPSTWKQTARTDFLNAKLFDTAATTGDLVTLAGSLRPLCDTPDVFVWSLITDGKGTIYAGTGNKGIVYKITEDGKSSVLYDSDEIAIQSLAMDSSGNLYAGTAPNGLVYKITPDGKSNVFFDADEKYITALTFDSKGNLYVATGDKCKVYRVSPDGKSETFLSTPENNAMSLAVDGSDNVYVGTGTNGIIYKVAADTSKTVLYDAAEDSVTALAVNSKGVVYAGTSPKGVIYKLAPGMAAKTIYDKAVQGITAIVSEPGGNVYAANTSTIFEVFPDDTLCTLTNKRDVQFISLALSGKSLYAGTGNIGSVYAATTSAVDGTLVSTVHDCALKSKFGTINWNATVPTGTSVSFRTRTGDTAEPDSTWSRWSAPCTIPGSLIASPSARYIQYTACLKGNGSASPKLKDVSIVYLPKNQAPKVTITSPSGGENWSKKKTIKWTGTDPDKDTLIYNLYYSGDNGTTWKPLEQKVAAPTKEAVTNGDKKTGEEKATEQPIEIDSSSPEELLAEMTAELDKHPEIPQSLKDKIMAEAPDMIKAHSADIPAKKTIGEKPDTGKVSNSTKLTSFSWDTSKVTDGTYLLKVTASDRLSNPTDTQTAELISEPFIVANKAPKLVAFKKTLTVQSDKSVLLQGCAFTKLVNIAGVQYRVDTGEWASAAADDGIYDTSFESFAITTQPLEKGKHTIEIKAIDAAGNIASANVDTKVE